MRRCYGMDPDEKTKLHEQFINQLDLQNPEVWAKMILDDGEREDDISEGDIILFSLVNRKMMEVDEEFYKTVEKKLPYKKYYVPYVYGFMVKVDKDNKKAIRELSKFSDKYLHCELVLNDSTATNLIPSEEYSLCGFTFFSASPFIYKNRTLKVLTEDENFDANINNYRYKNKSDLKNVVKRCALSARAIQEYIPSSELKGNIKVYNVGQAACSYLVSHSHRIMLDIGVDKRFLYQQAANEKAPEVIRNNYQSIQKCQPEVVILSHWDTDHILGVCLLNKKISALWIAPDISERTGNIPVGTIRLYYYLCNKNKLLSVLGRDKGQCFYSNNCLAIYKGPSKGRNKNNNHGLIVVFGSSTCNAEKIIFPGDCEYSAWPDKLKINQNFYSVLIVPHHGAKMVLEDSTMGQQDFRKRTAIFSYGLGNQYGHPSGEHVLKLKNRYGYDVFGTAEYNYIEILINLQDDIKFLVIPHPRTTLE